MLTNLIVTALVTLFVAIAVLGHVLVITALLTKRDGAKRADEPAERTNNESAGGLSTVNR